MHSSTPAFFSSSSVHKTSCSQDFRHAELEANEKEDGCNGLGKQEIKVQTPSLWRIVPLVLVCHLCHTIGFAILTYHLLFTLSHFPGVQRVWSSPWVDAVPAAIRSDLDHNHSAVTYSFYCNNNNKKPLCSLCKGCSKSFKNLLRLHTSVTFLQQFLLLINFGCQNSLFFFQLIYLGKYKEHIKTKSFLVNKAYITYIMQAVYYCQ